MILGKNWTLLVGFIILSLANVALSQTLCPDGNYAGGEPRLTPDGKYVGGEDFE